MKGRNHRVVSLNTLCDTDWGADTIFFSAESLMDLSLAVALQQSSSLPLRSGDTKARALLNPHRSSTSQTFRNKLEELEAALESQRQSIRVFARSEPIIGIKPGASVGVGVIGSSSTRHVEGDAEVDADVDDDAATVPGDGSGQSPGDDSMMIEGELLESPESSADEDGEDFFLTDDNSDSG